MYLFSKIKESALSLGLSIPKLGNRADVPSGHIYAWKKRRGENGYRGASDTELEKISAVLDISIVRLAFWRFVDELIDEYGEEVVLNELHSLYAERIEKLRPEIDAAKLKKRK
jgi:hypothetical protein